jgi:hypothetical protein
VATDTTELTFIRCPDCRSLVPAMSSRCRMCGATLAKDAKSDGSSTPTTNPAPTTSRVRQQTVATSSSSELSQQLNALRNDAAEPEDVKKSIPQQTAQETEEFDEFSDPLEDFLSEQSDDDSDDEKESALEASSEDTSEAAEEDLDEFDEFDDLDDLDDFDDLDDLDELDDDIIEEPSVEQAVVEQPKAEEPLKVDSATINQAKNKVEEDLKPKTRVVVEQGRGKFSKGLSFGSNKPRFDAPAASAKAPAIEPKQEVKVEVKPVVEAPKVEQKVIEEKISTPVITEKVLKQEPDMQPKFKEEHSEDIVEETKKPTKLAPAPVHSSVATKDSVKKGEQLGRIFGWLVSYTDPMGRSIELREGRFFVSSAQLRNTDLVLEDETVSTPHAMFTISTDGGIVIQDLKSERGVFVREPTQSTYRREYDSITLSHGDWVRFGDLEFLVSIIAHVGAN